jgi:hypothetical protein
MCEFGFANALPEVMLNRQGYPRNSLGRLDLIAILDAAFAELNCIEIHKYISRQGFVHVPRPGEILRLVNGNLHDD